MKLIASWLMALLPVGCVAAPHDAEVQAVRALYVRFAAEAVIDDTSIPGFMDAPRPVLRKHLTDELTRLLLRDRDCARRTQDICRIDWVPIWDGQDPVGSTVKLRWDAGRGRVLATLSYGDGSARQLAYVLVRERNAWRIADIEPTAGESLRTLLMASGP